MFIVAAQKIYSITLNHERWNWMAQKHVSILIRKIQKIYAEKQNRNFIFLGKIRDFLDWIKINILRERPELFLQNDSVYV